MHYKLAQLDSLYRIRNPIYCLLFANRHNIYNYRKMDCAQPEQLTKNVHELRRRAFCKIFRNIINKRMQKVIQQMKDTCHHGKMNKLITLRLCNIICRNQQAKAFLQIKSYARIKIDNAEDSRNWKVMSDNLQPKATQHLKSQSDITDIREIIQNMTDNIENKSQKHKRRLHLEIRNKILAQENMQLKEENDALNKRMIRENSKKKESLEMLAEELEEKNEVIEDLKKSLAHFEQKYQAQSSILEDEVSSLRKEVHDYAYIRQRLENDLDRTKLELSHANEKLKKLLLSADKTQLLLTRLEAQRMQQAQRNSNRETMNKELHKLLKNVKSRYKYISAHFQRAAKQSDNPEIMAKFLQSESSLKLQLIFKLLEDPLMAGSQAALQIFDLPQRETIERYRNRIQLAQASHQPRLDERDVDISGIVGRGLNEVDQNYHNTIFQILENRHEDAGIKHKSKAEEFQQEKNRLYEKISDAKRKILHIRSLVLEFLKTINIHVGQKTNSQEARLDMVLEFFEYSQEERSTIFNTSKSNFNFL